MDGTADPNAGLDGAGEGTPHLALGGFSGPLERLLALARAQQVDLARLSLGDLVDQLAAALLHAPPTTPLGQKGDWVVMASWLLQLRSLLLLPADTAAHQAAAAAADQFRQRLLTLREAQALATWLERRPQLGRDVFVRGQPELFGASLEPEHQVDVIEFLWASLALFDDDAPADTASVYRPPHLDFYSVAEARARIMLVLTEMPDGALLGQLLPDAQPAAEGPVQRPLRKRSAWSSTFIASLELARQGEVALAQDGVFTPIHVRQAGGLASGGVEPSIVSGEFVAG